VAELRRLREDEKALKNGRNTKDGAP
jgi:hypothetical protein